VKVIAVLDRASDTCWDKLVGWAVMPTLCRFGEVCNQTCKDEAWCGKCFDSGRLRRDAFDRAYHIKPLSWFKFKPFLKLGHALGLWVYEPAE
jgi:hypothetical protein